VIGFSSDWGNGTFPDKQLKVIYSYGAVPLVYWSPWDRPLGAPQARNRLSLKNILAGQWDSYIDMWAKGAKALHQPIMVSWGLEMNGEWFPWSGWFFGAGAPAPGKPKAFAGPEMYKAAYRYVVNRVRR
jgi:beta-mannanase